MRCLIIFALLAVVWGHSSTAPDKDLEAVIEELKKSPAFQTPYGAPASNAPVHFHLSFAGANGMYVLWETDTNTPTHTCNYGTQSGALTLNANGTSRSYGTVYTHVVTLKNLQPFTQYFYSCGDATYGFSAVNHFMTARKAGDATPFSFAIVGDMGIKQSNGVASTMISQASTYEFVYHVGDLGYADDYYLYLSTYEHVYAAFLEEIEPMASIKGYMGLPGNHEATCNEALPSSCENYYKNFTAYRTRWQFPCAESGGTDQMWYSYDYGLIHFVQISTETDFTGAPEGPKTHLASGPFGDQMTWLRNDLTKAVANRGVVPWIIVSGHRPIFYSDGQDSSVHNTFLPLMEEFGVDFYFSGHEHNYERYYPINSQGKAAQKDYNNPTVPMYFVNGAGGNVEGHQNNKATADYLAFRDNSNYGWNRFSLLNVTHVKWEYITDKNVILDSVTIYKAKTLHL